MYMKRTQRTARLRITIRGSHKVIFGEGVEPTKLSTVENGVATTKATRPVVQSSIVSRKLSRMIYEFNY